MKLNLLIFLCFALSHPLSAAEGPYYFTAIRNASHEQESSEEMKDSYRVLREMVRLAGAQDLRLTLLFSAQYADFISSDASRLSELNSWKDAGHEVGAYHQGPDTGAWDGYSDLPAKELARVRRDGGAGDPPPGHAEYFKALSRLEPAIKTSCMADKRDREFQKAGPPYEICRGARGLASKGAGYSGVNEHIVLSGGTDIRKHLSFFHPADRRTTEAAKKAFSGMKGGVYGTVFDSTEKNFGPFYVWLAFLREADPGCGRSRTVNTAMNSDILKEKRMTAKAKPRAKKTRKAPASADRKYGKAKPSVKKEQEIPRLRPVPSFFGNPLHLNHGRKRRVITPLRRGRCGDGLCDQIEELTGACPRDCSR